MRKIPGSKMYAGREKGKEVGGDAGFPRPGAPTGGHAILLLYTSGHLGTDNVMRRRSIALAHICSNAAYPVLLMLT